MGKSYQKTMQKEISMNIQTLLPILAAIVVLIVVGLVIWIAIVSLRSLRLKRKYGPEYDYTLDKLGDHRTAEAELKEREKRVVKLDIRSLNEHEREQYHAEWTEIQASFVNDPAKSVGRANRLITEVMIARGFPVADFEQRVADLSVLYPNFAPKYRQANAITSKTHNEAVSTEDLRQAMVDYHSLIDQLLETVHTTEPIQEPTKEMEAV
jgi:hypothetical protein